MIKPGTIINGHKIIRELGRGGMGAVYEAFDPNLERRAAVKIILPEQAGEVNKKRFIREAAAISRCSHPGIKGLKLWGIRGFPVLHNGIRQRQTAFGFPGTSADDPQRQRPGGA